MMGEFYQFSQSSLETVKLCIDAACHKIAKWDELFKPITEELEGKQENISFNNNDDSIMLSPQSFHEIMDESDEAHINHVSDQAEADRIAAVLEAASNKLDCLTKQCNYELLLPTVSDKLSPRCIEKLCEDVVKSLNNQNEIILIHFLPIYIRRQTSCAALNLLVQGYKTYPDTVMALMETLFTNTDIPSKLLEEFFIAVDETARSRFFQAISVKGVSTEVFILRLSIINCLYKSCSKTFEINNFLLDGLLQSSDLCQDDKNYGRCLLTFFQGLDENSAQIKRQSLGQLVDRHRTPFKKPCQALLNKVLIN